MGYFAINIDNKSYRKLMPFKQLMPEGWDFVAHHLTLTLKGSDSWYFKRMVGHEAEIVAYEIGYSDKAVALKCEIKTAGVFTESKFPHITLGYNKANGAKPSDSNDIVKFIKLPRRIYLTGTIQKNMETIKEGKEVLGLKDLPFLSDIESAGGKAYAVGGYVRDLFLNKPSKDLDIVVAGIPKDSLLKLLSKYGKVDEVGASFGVIKLTVPSFDEPIDIALPRKDIPFKGFKLLAGKAEAYIPVGKQTYHPDTDFGGTDADKAFQKELDAIIPHFDSMEEAEQWLKEKGIPSESYKKMDGYTGFRPQVSHLLSVEDDLGRRDLTFNSLAMDKEGNIIDPFGGIEDIKNRMVRPTDPKAFVEDPLRMVRAIQFASRFGFSLSKEARKGIKANRESISKVSEERFFIEFDKIVEKGDSKLGIRLLVETGMFPHIFGFEYEGNFDMAERIGNLGEFMWFCTKSLDNPLNALKKRFGNLPLVIQKVVGAYIILRDAPKDGLTYTKAVQKAYSLYPELAGSRLPNSYVRDLAKKFRDGHLPKSEKELDLKGGELKDMGYKFTEIGNLQSKLMDAVLSGTVPNDRDSLLGFISGKTQGTIPKGRLAFYDFDGTLMDSPLDTEENRALAFGDGYKGGWWSRPESLDTELFDIQARNGMVDRYRKDVSEGYTPILLTARMESMRPYVKKLLDKFGLKFEMLIFKDTKIGGIVYSDKGEQIMAMASDATESVRVYDDRDKELAIFRSMSTDFDFEIFDASKI